MNKETEMANIEKALLAYIQNQNDEKEYPPYMMDSFDVIEYLAKHFPELMTVYELAKEKNEDES